MLLTKCSYPLPFLVRIPSNKKNRYPFGYLFYLWRRGRDFFALRLEKWRNSPPEPSSVARFPRSHFWFESLQIKKQIPFRISVFLWRRGRDSNPRMGISHYTISNRAPSTNSATSPCCFQLLILPQKNPFVNTF